MTYAQYAQSIIKKYDDKINAIRKESAEKIKALEADLNPE
jgi:hypothetical protein